MSEPCRWNVWSDKSAHDAEEQDLPHNTYSPSKSRKTSVLYSVMGNRSINTGKAMARAGPVYFMDQCLELQSLDEAGTWVNYVEDPSNSYFLPLAYGCVQGAHILQKIMKHHVHNSSRKLNAMREVPVSFKTWLANASIFSAFLTAGAISPKEPKSRLQYTP